MNKSKKIISFAILLFVTVFQLSFVFNVSPVAADFWSEQEGMDTSSGNIGDAFGGSGSDGEIGFVVANYIEIFLGLLGMIFVILMIMAGFKYMMATDEKETKEALEKIKHAVIGLAIILMSYGITVFVGKQINCGISGVCTS